MTADTGHKWIKFNSKQIGYYRVNYPTDMWKTFTDALVIDVNVLSISDRTNLIDDAFSLAEAQIISYTVPMELTKYLKKEREYVPWSSASSKLSKIHTTLSSTNLNEKYQVCYVFFEPDLYLFIIRCFRNTFFRLLMMLTNRLDGL